jgi:type II secretory pathway predicted ATPase ExeA
MYKEFYGFSEQPFELTPNPRFLFLTRSHREALASMVHGIKNRKGFISMTGEVGTGKTTLIHSVLNRLDNKVKTVLIFHTTITFTDLLKTILHELDLATVKESRMDLLHQLLQHLVLMGKRGETLVIIIDEAQKLPQKVMEGLQMFSDLESKGIQIVFVGQPELEDKLNSESLKQLKHSIEIRRQIRGLSEEESKEYIDHRLRLVGSSSSAIFSPKALSLICSYAQGIPRVINALCDNALLMGYSLFKKNIEVDIIREVIKNMEGPSPQEKTFSSTTVVNKFHAFPFGLQFFLKKAYLIIIIVSLLCLGTFIFLTRRYMEQKSAKTWDIKSLQNHYVDTEPPSTSTSSQIAPPSTSIAAMGRQYKLNEIVAVKKGQTISQLTQKYYGTVNITLIDFLLEVNPKITNVHLITVDQKIKIPNITEELLIIPSPGRTYGIHAGTFETPDAAKLYSNEPVLTGKKIEILPRKVSPRETWYRVMIGKFDNKDEVLKMVSLLKEKGLLPAFERSSRN